MSVAAYGLFLYPQITQIGADKKTINMNLRKSVKSADEHTRQEYEQFAVCRREHKEALGEAESIKALGETAKQLEQGQKKSEAEE